MRISYPLWTWASDPMFLKASSEQPMGSGISHESVYGLTKALCFDRTAG